MDEQRREGRQEPGEPGGPGEFAEADLPRYDKPLDPSDPRFVGSRRREPVLRQRELVASQGPGRDPGNPYARMLRIAVPALFAAATVVVGTIFFVALAPGSGVQAIGEEADVRSAVADRPHRVCREGRLPCAWITVARGRLVALNTSGPIREEFGRLGVAWCPSSGYFGSNVTGSRYDQAGALVSGPSIRSLDRFHVRVDDRGQVLVDFTSLTAGRRAGYEPEVLPPQGPDCDEIPFDRDADLVLGSP